MKHTVKRLMCLAFVLILTLSLLPMGALALSGSDTGSIVIGGLSESVTAYAYKLMSVTYDDTADQPKLPIYTWDGAVATWIGTFYSGYIDTADSNAVTGAFYSLTDDDPALIAFYDALSKAIRSGSVTLAAAANATGSGTVTLGDLDMGNYLVLIEDGLLVYRPSTVNLIPVWDESSESWVMSEAKLALKASEPGIDKSFTVNGTVTDVAKVGDTIEYTVTATVPRYPAKAIAKDYQLGDALPDGVRLREDTLTVKGDDTVLTDGYTVTSGGVSTLTGTPVDLLVDFDYAAIAGFESVELTYSAEVEEDVVLGSGGNSNTAYLDYSNNPYEADSWKEKNDSTVFYSFGIQVTKQDESKNALAGAEFSLSTKSDGSEPMTFAKAEDGYYCPAAEGNTDLAVDSAGLLRLYGLVPGTYYLTETKAPGGYVKLQTPVTIQITKSSEGESGIVEVTVTNVKGFTLPVTGGTGTAAFTAIGIVLMGLGFAVVLTALRRRKRVN